MDNEHTLNVTTDGSGLFWQSTREELLKLPLGAECVKLAEVASFFSPDGFPKRILKHLWDNLVAPGQAEERFAEALEVIRHHNVFQSLDPIRIKRLDRESILQTAKAEPGLEAAVGAALATCRDLFKSNWVFLYEHEGIRKYIPEWVIDDVEFWVAMLIENPDYAEACPWGKLRGREWCSLLTRRPEFAERCEWGKISVDLWNRLLAAQPQLLDHCPADKYAKLDWFSVLKSCPQLSERCPGEMWGQFDWVQLLTLHPQLVGHCPKDKLCSQDWLTVLKVQPQLTEHCPVYKLHGNEWLELLVVHPQLAKYCRWERLDGHDWSSLLIEQPQFAEQCLWGKFNGRDWSSLLIARPQFAEHCQWKQLDGQDWSSLLIKQPQFTEHCLWKQLDGHDWSQLLIKGPQFAKYCRWGKLDGHDWSSLLIEQPQFAEHCQWSELDGHDWSSLLIKQPQFAARCQWDELDGDAWFNLLAEQPQFADWSRKWIGFIVGRKAYDPFDSCHPFQYRQFGELEERTLPENAVEFLRRQPQFAKYFSMEQLSGMRGVDWEAILEADPQFFQYKGTERTDTGKMVDLLCLTHQYADYCDWEKFTGDDWFKLLCRRPEYYQIAKDKMDYTCLKGVFENFSKHLGSWSVEQSQKVVANPNDFDCFGDPSDCRHCIMEEDGGEICKIAVHRLVCQLCADLSPVQLALLLRGAVRS